MAKKREEVFIEDDEINLIDLIKIIYKWRYYALIVFLITVAIGGYFGLRKTAQPAMYTASVIIQPALFNGEEVISIDDIIKSGYIFNEVIKNIDDKNILYRELNINGKNVEEQNPILLKQWRDMCKDRVVVHGNTIKFTMYTKKGIYMLSDIIIKNIFILQQKLLQDKFNEYLNNMNKIFKQLSFTPKKNIYIQSLSIPIVSPPKVIISAKDNIVEEKKPSVVKYLVISLFIGVFIGLIVPFIIEFFHNIDFSQIKK